MKKLLAVKIQLVAATTIVIVLAVVLVAVAVARPTASSVADENNGMGDVASGPNIVSISHALYDDRPKVIVFMPVEQCAIQYCLTAEVLAQRFAGHGVNIVEAPVYAVPIEGRTGDRVYPIIDWGVYLVEPVVDWLPGFAEGEFGYGLQTTALVLIDADGQIVARHSGFTDLEGFLQEVLVYVLATYTHPPM